MSEWSAIRMLTGYCSRGMGGRSEKWRQRMLLFAVAHTSLVSEQKGNDKRQYRQLRQQCLDSAAGSPALKLGNVTSLLNHDPNVIDHEGCL